MVNYASDFGLLNSLFRKIWISSIPAFGLSLECLIYQVSTRSYRALTSVALFILPSVTPCASRTAHIMNQNWSESSFPTPLNIGSFTEFTMLNGGGGGGGVGEGVSGGGEDGGGVGGCGIRRNPCFIN